MDSQTPKHLMVAHDFTLSNSPSQLCSCLGGNHAGDEVFLCAESNHHSISVWGIDGHREKHALFSPLLSCFLNRKRKQGNASNIERLLLYQHASLQPKAKLKYNTNEDEWLRTTLRCTVVPRVPPTISFFLFSHCWIAKRSQGLALWRRWEFFAWLAPFAAFATWLSLHPSGGTASCGTADFWVTLQFPCNYLPPSRTVGATATSHGNTAPSHPVAARGAARQPRPRCPGSGAGHSRSGGSFCRQPLGRGDPARVCHPSPLTQGGCRVFAGARWHYRSTACLLSEGAVAALQRWGTSSVPSLAREAHTPAGCCAAELRLHPMAAWMLQLLIATTSSVITGGCRQCGHLRLVLSVCSEESSFALWSCVLFPEFPQNLPMNAAISLCVCGILLHKKLQLVTSSGQTQCNPLPFYYTGHSRYQLLTFTASSCKTTAAIYQIGDIWGYLDLRGCCFSVLCKCFFDIYLCKISQAQTQYHYLIISILLLFCLPELLLLSATIRIMEDQKRAFSGKVVKNIKDILLIISTCSNVSGSECKEVLLYAQPAAPPCC